MRKIIYLSLLLGMLRLRGVEAPAWLDRAGELRSSDPALLHGAGRVTWRAWSAAAFAEAARERKPVFVFVSANWCHGGREMERTSLADHAVAAKLNADFIPIKLDRDAMPETDLRLQQAVAALKGARGWPLLVVLTPEGDIIFGSTFLALQDDFELNKAGLRTTLNDIAEAWGTDRVRISADAAKFCRALKKNSEAPALRGSLAPGALERTAQKLQALFEPDSGTFKLPSPARFPAPRAIEVLLAQHARGGDKKSLELATAALDAMLRGGIYDQLEGGFHRYGIERFWHVPRFEKLPLLNAEMIAVLLHAWQVTGAVRYRAAAEQTLDFWLKLRDARGEFFPASVAPEARAYEDGRFYTWTVREIERLFADPLDLKLAQLYFGIDESGDQPQSAPGRNVLFEAVPLHEAARKINLELSAARERLEKIRAVLREERKRREPPPVDATPLCDANALLAAAFIEAGALLDRADYRDQGLKTLRAIIDDGDASREARPPRHVLNDPKSEPLVMDEAARAWAGLSAYELTGSEAFLKDARECLARIERDYRDILRGGCIERSFKRPPDFAAGLNWRTKSIQDTSEPSSNGFVALSFARMYALTGDERFREQAETTVLAFGKLLDEPSLFNATLTLAADALQNDIVRVRIIGKASDPAASALLNAARNRYLPSKSVQRFDTPEAAGLPPLANQDIKGVFAVITRQGDTQVAETVEELNKILNSK